MHRVGETSIANNGQKMTIIVYKGSRDIDVQFEDVTIVASKKFKKGKIRNPSFSSHLKVGETNVATNGQKMTIISYRRSKDIDIQFEDGTIVASKKFKKDEIRNPNFSSHPKVGETNTARNGQKMTIVAYRGCNDIDILFEDGTIVTNRDYTSFKRGNIKNPNFYNKFLGETNIANNGQKMTIIAYRNATDIDIKFEDGTVVTNKRYASFKMGRIGNPNFYNNKYLGEINTTKNGQKMTIVAYRGCDDIDIQFEDGTIVTNKTYTNFKIGNIKNPNFYNNKYLGETNTATNRQKMTIVSYRSFNDIDILFEDGTIVTNRRYSEFKKGKIRNPNFYNKFLGETNIANNGLKMAIVAYRCGDGVDIQFEDGTKTFNRKYIYFKMGSVPHPSINSNYWGILKDHKLNGIAYRLTNKSVYYYCECTKCGKKDILSPQQILDHTCKQDTISL